jgi:NADH-quinone oxidoreductase subunit G
MLIVGAGALARTDGAGLHTLARLCAEQFNMVRADWNGFNVLQKVASRVGGLDLGFLPQANGLDTQGILTATEAGRVELVWLLGADELDMKRLGKSFVVYQGHHGDAGAHRADVVLPGAAYTEKNALYINTEGRPQLAQQGTFPPGDAREDWAIVRAFSSHINKTLPFDNLAQLRAKMVKVVPHFANIGQLTPAEWKAFGTPGAVSAKEFTSSIKNFYMTDPISRSSVTMAKCTTDIRPLTLVEAAE